MVARTQTMRTPKKDAQVEMNWVSQREKQWSSVKKCAMLSKLVSRLNGKRIKPVNSRPVANWQDRHPSIVGTPGKDAVE